MLRSGVPLAEALEKIPDVIPANAYFLVKAGAESGTLPSALSLAAEVCAEQRSERDYLRPGIGIYLLTVFLIMANVFMFICYWIIPKMKKIFYDFNMELPDLTVTIIHTSDLVVNYFLWIPVSLDHVSQVSPYRLSGKWLASPVYFRALLSPFNCARCLTVSAYHY